MQRNSCNCYFIAPKYTLYPNNKFKSIHSGLCKKEKKQHIFLYPEKCNFHVLVVHSIRQQLYLPYSTIVEARICNMRDMRMQFRFYDYYVRLNRSAKFILRIFPISLIDSYRKFVYLIGAFDAMHYILRGGDGSQLGTLKKIYPPRCVSEAVRACVDPLAE